MSLVKYKLKDLATDFGLKPKDIAEIMAKYLEPAKSNTQVLNDDELNVIFDYLTQHNQISSLEVVFAVQPKPKAEEPKAEAPKAEEKKPAAPAEKKPGNAGGGTLCKYPSTQIAASLHPCGNSTPMRWQPRPRVRKYTT